MRSSLCLAVASVLCALSLATTPGTTVLRQQPFPELVARSERALLGRVVAVDYGYDDNRLPSTWVRLQVEDALYGEDLPEAGGTLTIKVFGAPTPMEDGLQLFIQGTPSYQPGERYLLLLQGDSAWGFTNTVGLPFGAFRITRDAGGTTVARSLAGNRLALGDDGLARFLPEGSLEATRAPADPAAPVPYSLLRRAVADLRRAAGGDLRVTP